MDKKKKENRGGRRINAGRKKLSRKVKPVTVVLFCDQLKWFSDNFKHGLRSEFIRKFLDTLIAKHNKKK